MRIRYWGRKAGLITSIITQDLKLKLRNAIVLDPFAGSGSILSELLTKGARGIYIDINPYAYLLAKTSLCVFNIDEYLQGVESVLARRRLVYRKGGRRGWVDRDKLYTIRDKSGVHRVGYFKWNIDDCKAVTLDGLEFPCSDFNGEPYYPYPKAKLYYPSGKQFDKKRGYNHIYEFFTKRSLVALTNMYHDVHRLRNKVHRDVYDAILLTFLSILYQSSKMNRLGAGTWGVNSYWAPKRFKEVNPYELFKRRALDIAVYKRRNKGHKCAESIDALDKLLNGEVDLLLLLGDSRQVLKQIPSGLVDLVFTDPPHVDEVQYMELSFFFNCWVTDVNKLYELMEKEIVVNKARGVNLDKYLEMLTETARELHRVLRDNARAVFVFHEEDENTLSKMVNAVEKAGFKVDRELAVTLENQRRIGDRVETPEGKKYLVVEYVKSS